MTGYQEFLRMQVQERFSPLIVALDRIGITANQVTISGLLICFTSIPFILLGYLPIAGLIFAVGATVDAIDGPLARYSHAETKAGDLLDRVADRIGEAGVFIAITVYFSEQDNLLAVALTSIAFFGSFLTSYIRAVAEAMEIDCTQGWITRVNRVILLCLGMVLGILVPIMFFLALATCATATQRFIHVRKTLVNHVESKDGDSS